MTTTSSSSVGLARQGIRITKPLFGQEVAGWISSTQTSTDGQVFYGVFATAEEALDWASNLINATVEPVYKPAFNAG